MSLCKDCVRGVRHDGTPKGRMENINGVDTYVTLPDTDYPKDKALFLLTDIFGVQLVNCRLLADDFAANGFAVYVPDYLNGDPIDEESMNKDSTHLWKWLAKHGSDSVRLPLDKVIQALKDQGVTTFGATGYCFGARYVFDLAFDHVIKAAAVAHPSLLKVDEDFDRYAKEVTAPLLLNTCTYDEVFPHEAQARADELLGNGKFAPGYVRNYYKDCTHGFGVRADLSNPVSKAGKEGAFQATVEWMIKYM